MGNDNTPGLLDEDMLRKQYAEAFGEDAEIPASLLPTSDDVAEEPEAEEAEEEAAEEAEPEAEEPEKEAEAEEEAPEAEPEGEPEEAAEEDKAEDKISPRMKKRIEKTLEKMVAATNPTQEQPVEYKPLDYTNAPDEGFKPEELAEDRRKFAEATSQQVQQRIEARQEQIRFADRLEADKEKVFIAHPELDPDNKANFDPAKAQKYNLLYQSAVGFDPATKTVRNTQLGYEEFVDLLEDTTERIAADAAATTAKNVARQASRQAVRPSGRAPKAPTITAESIAQMDDKTWEQNKSAAYAAVNKMLGI